MATKQARPVLRRGGALQAADPPVHLVTRATIKARSQEVYGSTAMSPIAWCDLKTWNSGRKWVESKLFSPSQELRLKLHSRG